MWQMTPVVRFVCGWLCWSIFSFKTFACEMVELYGIIRMVWNKLCNVFPIVLLKYNCFYLYILYISTGTISIVELMGILCFGWYIFHVHNSETVLYADDFLDPFFVFEFAELTFCRTISLIYRWHTIEIRF